MQGGFADGSGGDVALPDLVMMAEGQTLAVR